MSNRTFSIFVLAFFVVLVALIVQLPEDRGQEDIRMLRSLNNKTATALH